MSTVRIRNVNPLGHVDVPILRRQDDEFGSNIGTEGVGGLEPGEVIEVDAEIAGTPPTFGTDDDGNTIVLDYGSGLLAQVGNFELADGPAAPAPVPAPAEATTDDPAQEG